MGRRRTWRSKFSGSHQRWRGVMRKQWLIFPGIPLTVVILVGGWLLYFGPYPALRALVGVWENETQLFSAGPGEVRLVISRRGLIDIQFDHDKYVWWGPTQLHLRMNGEIGEIWSEQVNKT